MFPVQSTLLKATGFMPLRFPNLGDDSRRPKKLGLQWKILQAIVSVVGLILCVGQVFQILISLVVLMSGLVAPDPSTTGAKNKVMWTLEMVPSVSSNQVYLCSTLFAKCLLNTTQSFLEDIQRFTEQVKADMGSINPAMLEDTLSRWRRAHMLMLHFCSKLNEVFSWILFCVYCLDFVTLVGFMSRIASHITVVSDTVSILEMIRDFVGVLTFSSYCTVFALPFIQVHEQTPYYREITQELVELTESIRVRVCVIDGAELFEYTRGFVIGTFSLAVSMTVLIKEIMGKEEEDKKSQGSSAVPNCTCGVTSYRYEFN
ncbi:hypothetical protein RvY_18049 [Ramazzottius varieornatus]|uniref:Gustatory receptor n=1 Tax=Ramazzottius varieornatus TaxID=947166 RepID=A0A1D1WAJ4_RAMVA|nr:hypothetical protein RvY_18049 [Ramazzottius varieornatus]